MIETKQLGVKSRVTDCAKRGLGSGVRSALWMTRMMLPITILVAMLKWIGVIEWLSKWLSPAFEVIGLTGEAVVVFLTNTLSNLYSGIAVIATLDLSYREATILAVMGLICHNLIVETIIQRKAGANAVYIVSLRVLMAIVAAVGMNFLLPSDFAGRVIVESREAATALPDIALEWAIGMAKLIPMMFALIISLNILQQLLREFKLIDLMTIPLRPLMKVFGLPRETSFLWIVLNTLGLAYGGGVLIAELGEGEIAPRSAGLLNTHAAVTHSLLEDTLIFVAIGLPVLWLVGVRIVLSVVAVWGERIYYRLRDKNSVRNYELQATQTKQQ